MVDLSGGADGPIEHGFSNSVFIIPAIVVVGLSGVYRNRSTLCSYSLFLVGTSLNHGLHHGSILVHPLVQLKFCLTLVAQSIN